MMKSLFKKCRECDNGWVREPDGYGCVQWTLCVPCGGDGLIEEVADDSARGRINAKAHDGGPLPDL